jgi:hypothetical protein
VKTVKTDKSGKSLNVLVDSKQSGWKFPDGFATQASGDGTKTYYAIPVEYTLLEPADASRTLADIVADYKALGIDDPIAEMNAGLKLAQGDLAKSPYRVKKAGATMLQVITWLTQTATDEQKAAFNAIGDPVKAAAYVAEQMAE